MARTLVEIKAETTQYQQAMRQAAAEMKKLTSEHSLAAAQAKLNGSAQDALKAKVTELTSKMDAQKGVISKNEKQYDNLKSMLDLQKTAHEQLKVKVDAAKKAYEDSAKAAGEDSEETQKLKAEYEKLNAQLQVSEKQINQTETAITRQEAAVNNSKASLAEMEVQLREVNAELARAPFDAYAAKAGKIGGTLTSAAQKLMPLSAGVAALGVAAVKTTADFDSEMSKVSAISGATGAEFDKLRDKAREMGSKTKFSATEAGEAMEYMAMAGWKTGDMLDGIDGIMNLAAASGEDLATTSDIVTDALTAFGLTASDSAHFADILAAASSNANTNVSMMGETFKYCAPIAGALGFSAEDTAEAIGLMANAGIKSSQAGTALRAIMNNLAGEVKICGENIGEVTVATTNADGSMRGLSEILADCRTAFSGLSESEKASAAQSLVGTEAMSGFLALMNAGEGDIEKLSNAIANCDGASANMAETMQDNLQGQLTTLMSQLQELAIGFGDLLIPKIREVVTHVQNVVDKLNNMDEGTKRTILNVGLFVAALAPVLLGLGKMITFTADVSRAIGTLSAGFTKVGGLSGVFSKAIGLIASPVGIAVAAIGALAGIILYLWNTNEEFRNTVTQIWEQIKGAFETFAQGIGERLSELGITFGSATAAIKAVWDGFCNLLAPVIEGAFRVIASVLETAFNVILGIWDLFSSVFSGNWSGAWEAIKSILSGVWEGIKGVLSAACDTLKGIADVFLGWFGTNWESVWNNIKSFFEGIWNGITGFFTQVWETIKSVVQVAIMAVVEIISAAFQLITLPFRFIWENCKDIVLGAWEAIKTAVSTAINYVKDTIISPVMNAIKSVFSTVWNAISSVVTTVWNTIKNVVSTAINAVKNTVTTIWNAVKSATTTAWNAVRSAVQTPINAAKSAVSTAINAIRSVVSSAWNSVRSTTTSTWNAIRNAIMTPINAARNAVHNAIEAIKAKFRFSWSLPRLRLPHVSISGSFSLRPPSVPHFSIAWYKNGGIMTDPTVFGMAGNKLLAGGEAGAEAILPLKEFYDRLGDMLDQKMEALAAGTNVYVYVTMDGEVVATKVYSIVEDKIVRDIQRKR